MSSGTCLSNTSRVRIIVFSDLVIALLLTIYRVTSLSLILRKVFGTESLQQVDTKKDGNGKPSLEQLTLMKFSTVFLITAAVIGLAIETFLFFLLNNGARSKNYRHCKHWFIARVLLLLVSVFGSVIEFVRNEYTVVDAVLEIEKLYRLLALFVVRKFMQEIYKGMSDRTFEYSSTAEGYYGNGFRSHSHSQSHVAF